MTILDEKRKQVSDQCRVVEHLATALAQINSYYAKMFGPDNPGADEILDQVGNRTARHMELLGNILSGMDAVEEEDRWTDSIFHKAHEMYPQSDSQ